MKLTTLVIRITRNKEIVCPIGNTFIPRLLSKELDLIEYQEPGIEEGQFRPDRPPNLIILKHGSTYAAWKGYTKIRRAWGNKSFILVINEEAYDVLYNIVDYSLSYKENSDNNLYIITSWLIHEDYIAGHAALMAWHNMKHDTSNKFIPIDANQSKYSQLFEIIKREHATSKNRFCNFIYGRRNLRYPGVRNRNQLSRELDKYKRVDCAGRVMNNTKELHELEKSYPRDIAKLMFISKYKFTIIGENRNSPLYITEKLLYPLLVGSIPIYCGTKQINKLLNPQAFINCNDYKSFTEVVERVKEIDNDPTLYEKYINAPLFLDESLIYDMSADNLQTKLQNFVQKLKNHHQLVSMQKRSIFTNGPAWRYVKYLFRHFSYLEYAFRKARARARANEIN